MNGYNIDPRYTPEAEQIRVNAMQEAARLRWLHENASAQYGPGQSYPGAPAQPMVDATQQYGQDLSATDSIVIGLIVAAVFYGLYRLALAGYKLARQEYLAWRVRRDAENFSKGLDRSGLDL